MSLLNPKFKNPFFETPSVESPVLIAQVRTINTLWLLFCVKDLCQTIHSVSLVPWSPNAFQEN